MADYTQPTSVEQRVRFFDGQYLQDQDFVDEQKYHLDRERRLAKALRVTGIVEGLGVSTTKSNQITVDPGTAIDGLGRQLVVSAELSPQQRSVDLPAAKFDNKQGVRLLIVYQETPTLDATTGIKSQRRWLERPRLVAVTTDGQSSETTAWDDKTVAVQLCQFNLVQGGVVQLVPNSAQWAGLMVNGNVGIGTTDTGSSRLVIKGGDYQFKIRNDNDNDWGITNWDNKLYFQYTAKDAATVNRVVIAANGSVGITAVSPGAKLSFNDVNDGSNGADGITWYNPSPTAYGIHRTAGGWAAPDYQQLRLGWQTGIVLDPGTAYGKSYVDIQGNGLRVTSGNVGIGTTDTGSSRLVIKGGDYQFKIRNDNDNDWGITNWDNKLYFQYTEKDKPTQNRIIIDSSGSVGIGTTSPDYGKLQVQGNIYCSGRIFAGGGLVYFWGPDGAWKNIQNRADNWAGSYTDAGPSDIRFKTDVRPIRDALSMITRLQGTRFRWNEAGVNHFTRNIAASLSAGPQATEEEDQQLWATEQAKACKALSGENIGLVAQDVEDVVPEVVREDELGYKHIRYPYLTALLIEAVKEQNVMIQTLSDEMAAMRESLAHCQRSNAT